MDCVNENMLKTEVYTKMTDERKKNTLLNLFSWNKDKIEISILKFNTYSICIFHPGMFLVFSINAGTDNRSNYGLKQWKSILHKYKIYTHINND